MRCTYCPRDSLKEETVNNTPVNLCEAHVRILNDKSLALPFLRGLFCREIKGKYPKSLAESLVAKAMDQVSKMSRS